MLHGACARLRRRTHLGRDARVSPVSRAAAALPVPSSNRGLKSPKKKKVLPVLAESNLLIDYCTFTASLEAFVSDGSDYRRNMLQACLDSGEHLDMVAGELFAEFLAPHADIRLSLDTEKRGYLHGYSAHFRLMAGELKCGFIAFGGDQQRGTFCIQLTGAGCAHVKAWDSLRAKLETAGARLTRVDVAYDDFKGRYNLRHVDVWYRRGRFTTRGRPPARQDIGWNDESGRTIYVGKNANNQQLCAYEKGKQLGDKSSPWTRFEGRFGSKYRPIALDILTSPAAYFVGHFPVFQSIIGAVASRMVTHVKRAVSTFGKAMAHCRMQYGGLLEILRRNSADATEFGHMAELLTKAKLPAWVGQLPYATQTVPAAVAIRT